MTMQKERRSILKSWKLSLLCFFFFFNTSCAQLYHDKFVALGTGSKSGVYYPVGASICALLNENRDDHLLRCFPYATGGSIYNIHALRSGELDAAITRADLAYQAANGQGVFKSTGPVIGLRVIASLYDNPVGIIVHRDSTIQSLEDLIGSRINVGNIGSGQRDFSDLLFKAMNWQSSDFEFVGEMSTGKTGQAFCAGEVNVLIQAMGIPAKFYDKMINDCDGRFVPISEDVLARLTQESPFLKATVIPGGMYDSNPDDVQTIGTKAVLVTMDRVDPQAVYQISASIFSRIESFRDKDIALKLTTPESMANEGVYLPFHAGAVRYFKEHDIPFSQLSEMK
jgi:TRAP transporter TAXI family solute receptor